MMSFYKTVLFALLLAMISACQDKGVQNVQRDSSNTPGQKPVADIVVAVPDTKVTPQIGHSSTLAVAILRDEQAYQKLLKGIAQWNYQNGDTSEKYKSSNYYAKILLPHLSFFLMNGDLSKVYTESGLQMNVNHKKSASSSVIDEDCPDSIFLRYDEEMQLYFLQIEESYWIDQDGRTECYGSDQLIYFKIDHNEIEVVNMAVAG